MKKNTLLAIGIGVVLIAAAFYGGMQYDRANARTGTFTDFQNLTSQQRAERFQQMGGIGSAGRRSSSTMPFVGGEIIGKDNSSITVKLTDGGSRIVFFSPSLRITKFVEGSKEDLVNGTQVTVNGSSNADGSVTAGTIQIRPLLSGRSQ